MSMKTWQDYMPETHNIGECYEDGFERGFHAGRETFRDVLEQIASRDPAGERCGDGCSCIGCIARNALASDLPPEAPNCSEVTSVAASRKSKEEDD